MTEVILMALLIVDPVAYSKLIASILLANRIIDS
jgi:hypothetical protein